MERSAEVTGKKKGNDRELLHRAVLGFKHMMCCLSSLFIAPVSFLHFLILFVYAKAPLYTPLISPLPPFANPSKLKPCVANNSIVHMQWWARWKHERKARTSCFTSSSSFSLVLSILLSFFQLFFVCCLLCKTDRSSAGFKVNGKAIFSLAHFSVHACHSNACPYSPLPLFLFSPFPFPSFSIDHPQSTLSFFWTQTQYIHSMTHVADGSSWEIV